MAENQRVFIIVSKDTKIINNKPAYHSFLIQERNGHASFKLYYYECAGEKEWIFSQIGDFVPMLIEVAEAIKACWNELKKV